MAWRGSALLVCTIADFAWGFSLTGKQLAFDAGANLPFVRLWAVRASESGVFSYDGSRFAA